MPPNLAQGAAVAIEDGVDAAASLFAAFRSQSISKAACLNDRINMIAAALNDHQLRRSLRSQRHSTMTWFTAMLCAMSSSNARELRDLMPAVPEIVNGSIFDAALNYSMLLKGADLAGAPAGQLNASASSTSAAAQFKLQLKQCPRSSDVAL